MPRKAKVAPGQQYGQRKIQQEAQQIMPMAEAPDVNEVARQFAPDVEPIAAPGRPGEPVTAGLPLGPGSGPEVLGQAPQQTLPDPDILLLAPMMPALEILASNPDSAAATRNVARILRSRLPAELDYNALAPRVTE